MKLRDLLMNFKPAEGMSGGWVDFSEVAQAVGVDGFCRDYEAFGNRFKTHSVAPWLCTDTWVGLCVLTLDDVVVGITMQKARKSPTTYEWVSQAAYNTVREYVHSFCDNSENVPSLIDLDKDMGDGYSVGYGSQLLSFTIQKNGEDQRGIWVTVNGKDAKVVEVSRSYQDPVDEWSRVVVEYEDGTREKVGLYDVLVRFWLRDPSELAAKIHP